MSTMNSYTPSKAEAYDKAALVITITSIVTLILTITWMKLKTKKKKNAPPLPPGPTGLPLLGNLLSLSPDLHTYFTDLSQKYGPIFKLWFGQKLVVVINSPDVARQVLKDQDVVFANRAVTASSRESTYGGSDMASAPHGPEWRMLRKVAVRELLSNTSLNSVYEFRRRELRRTIGNLYEKKGSTVDVGEVLFSMILDVITSMLWGGTLEDAEERQTVGAHFKKVINEIIRLLIQPNVSDFYPWLARFDLQGIQRNMRTLAKKMDGVFEGVIRQRVFKASKGGDQGDERDFVQVLMEMKDKDGGDGKTRFTRNHLKALLMNVVTGGTDSTATTVEFALAEVINNREVHRKILEELDEVVGRDRKVEESDIHELHYLYAVMKEVLRLHPTVPLLVPHSPSETCEVAGYTIPKGSTVFINAWGIHRNPDIWEDPTKFLPQRFIDAKWDYSGNDFRYLPFGSGRRACVGIAMAERMFMYLLASLLHSFDWVLPPGERVDMSEKFGIVLKLENPLLVIPTPRLSDSSLYD